MLGPVFALSRLPQQPHAEKGRPGEVAPGQAGVSAALSVAGPTVGSAPGHGDLAGPSAPPPAPWTPGLRKPVEPDGSRSLGKPGSGSFLGGWRPPGILSSCSCGMSPGRATDLDFSPRAAPRSKPEPAGPAGAAFAPKAPGPGVFLSQRSPRQQPPCPSLFPATAFLFPLPHGLAPGTASRGCWGPSVRVGAALRFGDTGCPAPTWLPRRLPPSGGPCLRRKDRRSKLGARLWGARRLPEGHLFLPTVPPHRPPSVPSGVESPTAQLLRSPRPGACPQETENAWGFVSPRTPRLSFRRVDAPQLPTSVPEPSVPSKGRTVWLSYPQPQIDKRSVMEPAEIRPEGDWEFNEFARACAPGSASPPSAGARRVSVHLTLPAALPHPLHWACLSLVPSTCL